MLSKECKTCKKEKTLDLFFSHPQCRLGVRPDCKACWTKKTEAWKFNNIERYRDYHQKRKTHAWDAIKADPEKHARAVEINNGSTRRYRKRNPIRTAAARKVGRAVKAGKIIKTPCEVCGQEKVLAHHCDYSKPLDVMWLCHRHHSEWHRKNKAINGD